MPAHVSRCRSLLVAISALACGPFLVMPAAHATSPYDPTKTELMIGSSSDPGANPETSCTPSGVVNTAGAKALVANGPARFGSVTQSVTATNNDDASDTVSSTSSATVRGWLHASGSEPTSIDVTTSGISGSTAAKTTSACTASTTASGAVVTQLTLHRATVASIDASATGSGGYTWLISPPTAGLSLLGPSGPASALVMGSSQSITSHTVMYLPAGTYVVVGSGLVTNQGNRTTAPRRGTARVHIMFAAAGSRTAAARSAYVLMPTSRSCSTHRVTPKITTSAKLLKKIKSITFQVNGRTVKKLTHLKRGALVKLAAPDNRPITVTAKVQLRTGKTTTASASYLQCS